jgi:CRP/FNR family transcriptional regulator
MAYGTLPNADRLKVSALSGPAHFLPSRAHVAGPRLEAADCKTKTSCSACPVASRSLCTPLHADSCSELDEVHGEIELAPGVDLFWEGDELSWLYTILDGWLFSYTLFEDGRRQILQVMLPGDIVGSWLSPGIAHCAVQALTTTRLCILPCRSRVDLVARFPEMAVRYGELLQEQAVRADQRIASLGRHSARQRIAYFLIDLYCRVRERSESALGSSIPMPLTQEHIADLLGLTSVHVCRILGNLRAEGIIRLHGRNLHVLDPDRLVDICDFDCETAAAIRKAVGLDGAVG